MKRAINQLGCLCTILLTVCLSGCASQNLFQSASVARADTTFQSQKIAPYLIRKDDKISISVWNHDDLSVGSLYSIYSANEVYGKWVMVDSNGDVPVPKLGKVKLEGLTILQARECLQLEFKKWIVDPIIDLKVLNKEVTLLGELKNPGKFLLEKESNTLIELLGRAGDFDLYANRQAVKVIRTIDNQPHTLTVDLTRLDRFATNNIQILPGDVVYVPAKKGKLWDKRAGPSVLPIASAVTTLLVLVKFLI